ncbi:hypothetical protein PSTT_06722 [Puccinia striiformis]|uniref:Alpha-1,2-Mannosidase n=1 Tax=Puccinia striiformis TaxID=27350 RepID=A0A2S4VJ07_9BASI|nr:hypothetical protein PSTT_06722 [Puccinia striiformis]
MRYYDTSQCMNRAERKSSSRSGETMAGFADLIRSRLRALVPVGLISLFGASIYVFFRSLSPSNNEFGYGEVQHPHYQFKIDGLGRVGVPDSRLEGGLIFNTNEDDLVTPELKAYEPDQLMSLPILHRTSKDPFDTKNGFKPLRPSQSPWSTDTQSGLMLINRLSRNRFPSADSNDPNRGSLPPPLPPWPSPKILKEKQNSLKKPISKDLISGLNTSYVWADRHLIQDGKLPKIQWDGFDKPNWESHLIASIVWNVKTWFSTRWEGYKARAWGHDELRPISGSFQDPFAGWGATLVDYMGGLISAYDLSGDELMLERAEELAEWLVPAFGTSSGLPSSRYQMGSRPERIVTKIATIHRNPSGEHTGRVCIAEIGSLTLEFTRLSQLTSKEFYYDVIKQHQLLRGTNSQYSKMYTSAIESAREHLIRTYNLESNGGKNLTVIGDIAWGMFKPSLDHLTCFSGAMIGLGSQLLGRKEDLDLALEHADACVWAYESTKTGVGPERITIVEGDDQTRWQPVIYEGQNFRELKSDPLPGASIQDGRYLGRPETIDTLNGFCDDLWLGPFTTCGGSRAIVNGKIEDGGCLLAGWKPVQQPLGSLIWLKSTVGLHNSQINRRALFWQRQPDLISLDEYVFNTEAHPFRLEQANGSKGSKAEIKRYWNGSDSTLDEKYYPPGILNNQTGFGTFLQQWSRVDLDKISDADRLSDVVQS